MYFVARFSVENVAQNVYVAQDIWIIVAHCKNVAQYFYIIETGGKSCTLSLDWNT